MASDGDTLRVERVECPGGAIGAAESLYGEPHLCFLDSSLDGELGRWSFVGVRPFAVVTFSGGAVTVNGRDAGSDVFTVLAAMLDEHRLPTDAEAPPFACGAMGYLSYDLGRFFEEIPSNAVDDLPQPDLSLAFYDCALAFDNSDESAWLSYLPSGRDKAMWMRERIESGLLPSVDDKARLYDPKARLDWSGIESNFTRAEYLAAIARVKDYIAAGDVYQINLSQRFSVPYDGDAWRLYKTLRSVNPSPFGCYLDFPELTLASASPERLVHLDAATRMVETRPIKGTRPRGLSADEDSRLAAELAASIKDRAENVMIVDMERNDLGRVCEFGSVHVPELWTIETHPNVFQMVSVVRGRLDAEKGPLDLLANCFPGGSITGAPKVRAMQIIDEIEPTRRGIYTGSVGYIDFRGNADFNIVIRSLLLAGGRAYFHAGGGVVWDSVPEQEYQETLDKAGGLLTSLLHFSVWEDEIG